MKQQGHERLLRHSFLRRGYQSVSNFAVHMFLKPDQHAQTGLFALGCVRVSRTFISKETTGRMEMFYHGSVSSKEPGMMTGLTYQARVSDFGKDLYTTKSSQLTLA